MNRVTLISDPETLFNRWFAVPMAQLEKLNQGDGATAGMMIAFPLFERYLDVIQMNDKSGRQRYDIMAAELELSNASEAELFWTTFRHGFCHTAMPLKQGWKLKDLPKPRLAAEFSRFPKFSTTETGEKIICLDPWKFIRHVMDIYQRDPKLLIQHPDAPLMGIYKFG